MSEPVDNKTAGAAPGPPPAGFTPERDRRLIMLSCLVLVVLSMFIFVLVRKRLVELRDVTGAYAQVSFTAADVIRTEAVEVAASRLAAEPGQHLAQWLTSSGTVVQLHDKKGQPIESMDSNPALGCVYWLDCGLPVTAVKPAGPVVGSGERIRFWGQIAETDVAKLEFSEEAGKAIRARFGLVDGERIAIFFASEIEAQGRDSPLREEHNELPELQDSGGS